MPRCLLLATDDTDRIVTVAIDGVRYEYQIGDGYETFLRQLHAKLRAGSHGDVINLLKRRARAYAKLPG